MSDQRSTPPEDAWDRFIDALDRAGQNGGAQNVVVPIIGGPGLAGRLFGELTRHDVTQLSRVAAAHGRRGETVKMLWEDAQRRLKPARPKAPRRPRRS